MLAKSPEVIGTTLKWRLRHRLRDIRYTHRKQPQMASSRGFESLLMAASLGKFNCWELDNWGAHLPKRGSRLSRMGWVASGLSGTPPVSFASVLLESFGIAGIVGLLSFCPQDNIEEDMVESSCSCGGLALLGLPSPHGAFSPSHVATPWALPKRQLASRPEEAFLQADSGIITYTTYTTYTTF